MKASFFKLLLFLSLGVQFFSNFANAEDAYQELLNKYANNAHIYMHTFQSRLCRLCASPVGFFGLGFSLRRPPLSETRKARQLPFTMQC